MPRQVFSMPPARFSSPPAPDALVLALSVAVVIPHLVHLPGAIALICGLGWFLALVLTTHRARLSKSATTTLVIGAVGALWFSSERIADVSFGFALLCVVIAMKPLETHNRRARRSFVLLGYFGALTYFFQGEQAAWLAYYGVCLVALTGLLKYTEFAGLSMRGAMRDATWLTVQAIPLALVLFYAFPRLSEPLWQWTLTEQGAVTGVPKELELDGLSSLAESNEIAFTATFDDGEPDVSALYWRGPVFYFTDGRTWDSDYYTPRPIAPERLRPGASSADGTPQSLLERAGETITYRVKQETGSPHWLLSLEMPLAEPPRARMTEDYQLVPGTRAETRRDYRMTSALTIETPSDPERVYIKALQLPFKPRMARQARALGQNLQVRFGNQPGSDRRIIQQVLLTFAEEPFQYTLNSPPYLTNPIDEFLFSGRQGYCTHYAAAMTVILRAARVPARMVMGYRGGDWDADTETLRVRQKHAHAWVEAWTEGHGWIRIDPTAVIPSDRILTQNQDNAQATIFNERLLARGDAIDEWRQFLSPGRTNAETAEAEDAPFSGSRLEPRYWLELAKFVWKNWVTGFDHERQRHLADASGGWLNTGTLLGALLMTPLLVYALLALLSARRAQARRAGRVGVVYQRLCTKLSKLGYECRPEEPHQRVRERLAATGQFDIGLLERVFHQYERLRYGQHESHASSREVRLLRRTIKDLLRSAAKPQAA